MKIFAARLRNQLEKPYILALVPLCLLVAFLIAGEFGLLTTATILTAAIVLWAKDRAGGPDEDPMTDLMTRDGLIDWVERALPVAAQNGLQVAVIFLTIDDLDAIETRFGRDMYRSVLREAVRRLQDLLRDGDVIARSGQSIAVGISNVRVPENENLMVMAQRLQKVFERPFSDGPTRTYCTVSLGIAAESHVKVSSGPNIVAGAQRASELAMVSGSSAIRFYSGGLSSEEALNRNTARELNTALETNEIFAWFQPQVRTEDGRVTGFEALARWDHPERGLVAPASFLPDIEKSGLSQRLAEVILKQSLMALNVWDAAGFDVPCVSVNFAAEELRNPRLPDYVRWELDRHGVSPERLVIEVLESVASESSEDVVSRTLQALSRIGCKIDLDDFGTGFTSFINVRRFNVDRIKIDRSLVNNVDNDEDQTSMFCALMAFGNRLGIEALAEGVETQAELQKLRSLGCRHVQGYAIGRPLPLGETMIWLEDQGMFSDTVSAPSEKKTL
ncbi:MAG: GGDEF domain-containing phosphodiesterase [Pseudomonadota bacterium]